MGKAITSLSTLFILSLITRYYGESGTGILTIALAYLGFFIIAVDLGFNAYLMPKLLDNAEDIWRKLFGLRILIAIVLMFVAGGVIFLLPNYDPLVYQLVLIGVVGALIQPAFFVTANAIFQAKLRYDLSIISSSIGSVLTFLLIYIAILSKTSLAIIMFCYLAGWLTTAIISITLSSRFIKNLTPLFDLSFMLKLVKGAWPISLALLLNVLYFRVDTFLLSFLKPFADVGIYNLSYSIFQAALVLPTFIMNSYYPMMIESFKKNQQQFFSQLRLASFGMALIGVLGIIATILLSGLIIIAITGGRGFEGSKDALVILSFGFPAYFVSALLMWTLVVMKRYKEMVAIYFIGLLFNIFTNLIFIPQYSYLATSWITGLSEYLILLLQVITILVLSRR